MSDNKNALLQRVRAIMPALEIEQFEINPEGLINEVVIVNQKYVFRFARTEEYARILDIELKILDLIRPQIGVSVPTPIYVSADRMFYPLLGGQPLSRKMVLGFDEGTQNNIAGQLGACLYRLHTTEFTGLDWEIPSTLAPVKRQNWIDIWQEVKDKIYPLFQKYQIEWAEDLFHSVTECTHPIPTWKSIFREHVSIPSCSNWNGFCAAWNRAKLSGLPHIWGVPETYRDNKWW